MQAIRLQPKKDIVYNKGKPFVFETLQGDRAVLSTQQGRTKNVAITQLTLFKKGVFIPVTNQVAVEKISTRSKRPRQEETTSLPKSNAAAAVNLQDIRYLARKTKENNELFQDVAEHLGKTWLSSVRILALDDFCSSQQKKLNTYTYFTQFGGKHSNFYVCNPNSKVFRQIYERGGHGFPMTVGDCLTDPAISLPKMDVFYLDYTCKFEKALTDLSLLFENHKRLFKNKVLLHLTVSKRQEKKQLYDSLLSSILKKLVQLGREYGYSVVPTRQPYANEKMFKIGVVLSKAELIKPQVLQQTQEVRVKN
jgi:hypothetical protein